MKFSFVALLVPSLSVGIAVAFASRSSTLGRSSLLKAAVGRNDEFVVGIVGDLHIDPRKMEDYIAGRSHFKPIFDAANRGGINNKGVALVSLGDLGEPKNCNHNPESNTELFAGTTGCHEVAAEFLSGFGVRHYDVVGGNHDLEGLDEFETDQENLKMYLKVHGKETPQFCREVAHKTLLVGMGSTVFRDAAYISHEVKIDKGQLDWFEELVGSHPAEEGWKIFVFTHAPPIGSGLRVLQECQVLDGCCWLNHSSDETERNVFINLVREHRCIKAWFSGHFHFGQDYQDSITFPTIDPKDGPDPNRGSCVFAQTSVMRAGTTRDGCQQSRLLSGNKDGFEIYTVDHQKGGNIRLDASITFRGNENEVVGVHAREEVAQDHGAYFKVYSPSAGGALHPPDDCFKHYNADGNIEPFYIEMDTLSWWYMSCGRVLGMLNGNLIEYDSSTLAPLGHVAGADELVGKKIGVIDSGIVLLDNITKAVTDVKPNEDGSYRRKFIRKKGVDLTIQG